MSATSIVQEYRKLGDSWPKAIRSTIELKVRIGMALQNVGYTIGHAGDRILDENQRLLEDQRKV